MTYFLLLLEDETDVTCTASVVVDGRRACKCTAAEAGAIRRSAAPNDAEAKWAAISESDEFFGPYVAALNALNPGW
jgi:hypothetical protein